MRFRRRKQLKQMPLHECPECLQPFHTFEQLSDHFEHRHLDSYLVVNELELVDEMLNSVNPLPNGNYMFTYRMRPSDPATRFDVDEFAHNLGRMVSSELYSEGIIRAISVMDDEIGHAAIIYVEVEHGKNIREDQIPMPRL